MFSYIEAYFCYDERKLTIYNAVDEDALGITKKSHQTYVIVGQAGCMNLGFPPNYCDGIGEG